MPNELNKSQFISLLGNRLQTKGFIVLQSSNDANELIVKCAVEINFADDTDLLVQPRMIDIFLFSTASKRSKSGQKIVSLKNVIDVTDPFIKENTFFALAWHEVVAIPNRQRMDMENLQF